MSGTPWCPYGTSTPQCSGSMARPAVAAAASTTSRPAAACAGVVKLGSQPSASRPTRRSSPGARPPSQTSGGCCTGRMPMPTPS